MISLIEFEDDLITTEEEAKSLGLKYNLAPRIGWQDEKLCKMNSYDRYKEDCIEFDGNYYENTNNDDNQTLGDSIYSGYIYSKDTSGIDYVHIEKKMHMIDLLPFAVKCKYKFFIFESIMTSSERSMISNDK